MITQFKNSHSSAFWGENQSPHIALFTLHAHQTDECSDVPEVVVTISQQGATLCLSHFVKMTDWLTFDDLALLHRQDHLWEKTCLECFFEHNHAHAYTELNFAPSGAFNVYHFDDYRTPNTLPPTRDESVSVYAVKGGDLAGWHVRHVGVDFGDKLGEFAKQSKPFALTKLNPTAILYKDGTPLFYAVEHATPPDFHDKQFWQTLS